MNRPAYFDVIKSYLDFAIKGGANTEEMTKGILARLEDSSSFRPVMKEIVRAEIEKECGVER